MIGAVGVAAGAGAGRSGRGDGGDDGGYLLEVPGAGDAVADDLVEGCGQTDGAELGQRAVQRERAEQDDGDVVDVAGAEGLGLGGGVSSRGCRGCSRRGA